MLLKLNKFESSDFFFVKKIEKTTLKGHTYFLDSVLCLKESIEMSANTIQNHGKKENRKKSRAIAKHRFWDREKLKK